MYTVALMEDLSKIHCVHWSLLKHQISNEVSEELRDIFIESPVQSVAEEELEDVDLGYVVPGVPPVACGRTTAGTPVLGVVTAATPSNDTSSMPLEEDSGGRDTSRLSVLPAISQRSPDSIVVPQRTGRRGAGEHSNRYHLPQAVGRVDPGVGNSPVQGSHSIVALFWPRH